MLRQLKFKIHHHDCWETKGSEKFPGISTTTSLSPFVMLKKTTRGTMFQGFVDVRGPNQELENWVEYIKNRSDIAQLRIVDKKPGLISALVKPIMTNSTFETIIKNKAVLLDPIMVTGGYEEFNLLVQSPKEVVSILGELDEIGELKVQKIGQYKGKPGIRGLTDKQKSALELAVHQGYYSHPRRVTIQELACVSGISRSTFQEHLRKAESKVIQKTIKGW